MGPLELLSYFWSLKTILVVQIENFDFGGLSHPPTLEIIIENHSTLKFGSSKIARAADTWSLPNYWSGSSLKKMFKATKSKNLEIAFYKFK